MSRTYLLQFKNGTKELTEKEIRGYGVQALLKKKWKVWLIEGIILAFWCWWLSYIFKPSAVLYVGTIVPVLLYIWMFYWTARNMGKRLLAYVKDKTKQGVSPVKINL